MELYDIEDVFSLMSLVEDYIPYSLNVFKFKFMHLKESRLPSWNLLKDNNYLSLLSFVFFEQICRLADVEGVSIGVWQHSSRPQPPDTSAESLTRGASISEHPRTYLNRIFYSRVLKTSWLQWQQNYFTSWLQMAKKDRVLAEPLWGVHLNTGSLNSCCFHAHYEAHVSKNNTSLLLKLSLTEKTPLAIYWQIFFINLFFTDFPEFYAILFLGLT